MIKIVLFTLFLFSSAGALTFEGLINLTEKNNLDILAEKHRLKSRVYSEKSTFRSYFPTFTLQSSATLFYPYQGYSGKYWNQSYSYGFGLAANPLNFQRNAQLKMDRFYIEYQKEELSEKRLDEYFKAIKYFLKLEGWKEKVEIRKKRFESSEKIYEVSVKKKKEGLVLLSDVLKAKANLERSKKELETAKNEYRKVENTLREILNVDESVDLTPEVKLKNEISLSDAKEILKFALENRPSLRKAKRSVQISKVSVSYEKSALLPQISLSVSYNRENTYWPPEDNNWSFSALFQWPIFDSGQSKYRALSKKEEEKIASIELKKEVNRVRRQVLNSLSDFRSAQLNVKSAEEYLRFAKRSYERTFNEYKKGVSDIVSLLTAFDELKNAEEQYIDTLVDFNISYFEILRYSGLLLLDKVWREW